MSQDRRVEHQITRILLAAVDGDASLDELAEVNRLIQADPTLAPVVVDVMSQHAWLTWNSTKARHAGDMRADLLEQIMMSATLGPAVARFDGDAIEGVGQGAPVTPGAPSSAVSGGRSRRWFESPAWAALAAVLVVAVSWVLGFQSASRGPESPRIAVAPRPTDDAVADGRYVARFVQGTACLWNSDGDEAFSSDRALRMGEALNLLEGLAEVQLDWPLGQAVLQIEGPAGLVLTADRGASLSHGKLTADIRTARSTFNLTTPNGQVEVSDDADLGVAIVGGDVELHVFRGDAAIKVPWSNKSAGIKRIDVTAGESLRVLADDEGRVQIERGDSTPEEFASQVSMGSDGLRITPAYVREVLAASPLLYWRFEDEDPNRVTNAVADRYHGHVVGVAPRVDGELNSFIDLGSSLTDEAYTSYVVSDDLIESDFDGGYSVEAWIKPSHYHWSTLVAMIGDPPQPGWRPPHAFLLELGGPRAASTSIEHPGRIRYLHRNPPSAEAEQGTSLFSEDAYALRKWQHVVAVKRGEQMTLYVNGKPAASGVDPTPLASPWRLLIGQLDHEQFYRRFVGQIDELAVYPRPLAEQEIVKHYELTGHSSQPAGANEARDQTASDANKTAAAASTES